MVMTMRWLYRGLFLVGIVFALACAGRQHSEQTLSPREGVYAVVSRDCDGPVDENQDCDRVRFIELVRGKFHGVLNNQLAIVEWLGEKETGPLIYQARPLRGRMTGADEYLIDAAKDDESEARESFLLAGDVPKEYRCQRQETRAAARTTIRTSFRLALVARDAVLAKRAPYPPPVTE
jgi:hypothetical protein